MHATSAHTALACAMLTPRTDIHSLARSTRRAALALAAAGCALAIAVPLASAKTITFTQTDTAPDVSADGMFGPTASPVPLGTTAKKLVIRTNKQDEQARRDQAKINTLQGKLDDSVATTNEISTRIDAIQQLFDETDAQSQDLKSQIEARLVEQYQSGESGNIAYLLAGGASQLLDRAHALGKETKHDQQLYDQYELSLDRLDELKAVLTELRSVEGERSEDLGDRIDHLGQSLVDARGVHQDASLVALKADKGEAEADDAGASAGGTWYIMGGAFQAGIFMPGISGMGTGQYDGGNTRTPHMAPTPASIAAVLALYQRGTIALDDQGLQDVRSGQIDDRVLRAMVLAAQQFSYIKITMLKTGHSVLTAGGNVSEHSYGCAMDIGTIGHTFIEASQQKPGGEVEAAVKFFAGLQNDLAPHQVISLFSLGGATLALSDHANHIHVGYHC